MIVRGFKNTRRHPCNRLRRPLRLLIAQLWIEDLKFLFGVSSARALEYAIECDRQGKERKTYRYTRRYKAIEQGRHFPDDARIERVRAIDPRAVRVLELPLWDLFDDQRELSLEELDQILLRLSPEIRNIVFHNSLHNLRGMSAHRQVTVEDVIRPLSRFSTIDSFTALLVILRKARLAWRDPLICSRSMLGALATYHRLSVFTPFYPHHLDLFVHLQQFIYREHNSLPGINSYRGWRAAQMRGFLEVLRGFGLIGPTIYEQMRFVVQFWVSWVHQEDVIEINKRLEAAESVQTRIRATGKRISVPPSDPFYELLKRMKHPATQFNQPIKLPRERPPEQTDDIVIAHAFGEDRCPAMQPQRTTDKNISERGPPGRQRQQKT